MLESRDSWDVDQWHIPEQNMQTKLILHVSIQFQCEVGLFVISTGTLCVQMNEIHCCLYL